MRLLKYLLLGLTTTVTIGLAEKASFGFSIIPEQPGARYYMPYVEYTSDNTVGVTWLDTRLSSDPDTQQDILGGVTPIALGGTPGFHQLLEQQFPGWTFNYANDDLNLKGRFEIFSYYACGTNTPCGLEKGMPRQEIVGSSFWVKYYPEKNDPYGNNVHWIQRVRSSFDPFTEQIMGNFDFIDIRRDPNDYQNDPYYDSFFSANTDEFYDRPNTIFANLNNYFTADLYLVEETAPQTVTIYNGVRWGWKNAVAQEFEQFHGSLSSNQEEDKFQVSELTPGAKYYAYINNDLPGNICNPNTFLTAYNSYGNWINDDNDSSPIGDGFASALTGTVSDNGTIDLRIRSAGAVNGSNRRGVDRGYYELSVMVFNNQDLPFTVGSSGGGGVSREIPGGTQHNPILPTAREGNWQVFRNVPGCRWYDPHTPYGFEFQALDDTLFSEILDFPVGPDNKFTVSVGDMILGEFGAGDRVDFTSLFGSGISNFKITGIDSLFGSTEETAFPIQLAFNDRIGSFKMRPFSQETSPQSVPESTSTIGLLVLSAWGIIKAMKIRIEK